MPRLKFDYYIILIPILSPFQKVQTKILSIGPSNKIYLSFTIHPMFMRTKRSFLKYFVSGKSMVSISLWILLPTLRQVIF